MLILIINAQVYIYKYLHSGIMLALLYLVELNIYIFSPTMVDEVRPNADI